MSDIKQATFDGWAIVDVLGHQRYVGYVTTEAYGQAVLFRVDVPALEERERVTKRPGYSDGRYLPAGTTVKEGAVAGYTKLIGSGSIYTLTPCTREAAIAAVEEMQARPLMSVALPPERTIEPKYDLDDDDGEEEDMDEDDVARAEHEGMTTAPPEPEHETPAPSPAPDAPNTTETSEK
jgi:hypothetical protein